MKIKSIAFSLVEIPFKTAIGHNLKERTCSESVVLTVASEDGRIGYGEGAPRNYVTGESAEGVKVTAGKALPDLIGLEINRLEDIETIVLRLQSSHKTYALAAALEIALLDILGQEQGVSIADFWASNNKETPVYSAVLPFMPLTSAAKWIDLIESLGIRHLKIKVGQEEDEACLAFAREHLGNQVDIRLDANRAWTFEEARQKIKTFEKYGISSVEEPLAEQALGDLPRLSQSVGTPLMLDESVYTLEQARFFTKAIAPDRLLFNLKISKCGGFAATSRLFHFARNAGVSCQLGCNVGETAILSAAGRLFAQAHPLKYLEGSYAPFFMEDDIVVKPFGFAANGRAEALVLPGLGISISPEKLKKYTNFETLIL